MEEKIDINQMQEIARSFLKMLPQQPKSESTHDNWEVRAIFNRLDGKYDVILFNPNLGQVKKEVV